MKRTAIWLDDVRSPRSNSDRIDAYADSPDDVLWVKTYEDFVEAVIQTHEDPDRELAACFFDNDLGTEKEGRDAFNWFENWVHEVGHGPVLLHAQTANPAARRILYLGFMALQRYWDNR